MSIGIGTRVIHKRYPHIGTGYVRALIPTTDRYGKPNGHSFLVRYMRETILEHPDDIRATPVQVPEVAA